MHYVQIYYDSLHKTLTMGENVRYRMHKYDIVNSAWSQNIDILLNYCIDSIVKLSFNCHNNWLLSAT